MSDKYNSRIARFVGWLNGSKNRFAVTISSKTTLYSCPEGMVGATWREHEDFHKQQIAKMGWFNFMATYLWRLITKGYKKSELETDAPKIK